MLRLTFALTALALLAGYPHPAAVRADEPKKDPAKPRVDLSGSIDDAALQKEAPANGVVVSQKAWEKLVKVWGIQDAPKVDFEKELLVVGTWKGSSFNLQPMVKDGDLTVGAAGTKDLRPGFRWRVQSLSREGIKTIQGKELPKE